ncbi:MULTISPECIES: hypothetical protein [Amycolatopsis]|uniref:hypothetical protein n=1 Tax=Amycolatopsis TaxID=1813 RepID=UPI0007DFB361|nr:MULTISPECIES: hypothetical protein [Amycolatopsis]OAP22789.1 hypothetical protein A4R44_06250 [Amycolatopsis sp. M39]
MIEVPRSRPSTGRRSAVPPRGHLVDLVRLGSPGPSGWRGSAETSPHCASRTDRAGEVPPAEAPRPEPKPAPANTPGLRRTMFAVGDINHTVARLRAHGAEPDGEIAR